MASGRESFGEFNISQDVIVPKVCSLGGSGSAEVINDPRTVANNGSSIVTTITGSLVGVALVETENLPGLRIIGRCPLQRSIFG